MTSVNATTFADEWAAAEEAIAENGEPIIIRQSTSIEEATGPDAGLVIRSPLSTSNLLSKGAFSTGVSSINLDAASVSGLLLAGDQLVYSGHATTYTVTGGPYLVASNALYSVGISPALSADVADDEAVSVTFTASDTALVGLFTLSKLRMVDGRLTRFGDFRVFVSQKAIDEAGITIERGDQLLRGSDPATARRMAVLAIEPIVSEAAVYLVVEEG